MGELKTVCRSTGVQSSESGFTFLKTCHSKAAKYDSDGTMCLRGETWIPLCNISDVGKSSGDLAAAAAKSDGDSQSLTVPAQVGIALGALASVIGICFTFYKLRNECRNQEARETILKNIQDRASAAEAMEAIDMESKLDHSVKKSVESVAQKAKMYIKTGGGKGGVESGQVDVRVGVVEA